MKWDEKIASKIGKHKHGVLNRILQSDLLSCIIHRLVEAKISSGEYTVLVAKLRLSDE